MKSKTYRLDRFIRKHTAFPMSAVRLLLAQRRIRLDDEFAHSIHQAVGEFTHVELDGQTLQSLVPRYYLVHKPQGVVSATCDAKHSTVMGLLAAPERKGLHIVGRLDYNSTGLVLLTNDGKWSKAINNAMKPVPKHYRVLVDKPIGEELKRAFHQGIYLSFEGVTTKPASLEVISPYEALVVLTEGRYHQIKRMFGQFQIKVLGLHRFRVGGLRLGDSLKPGEYRRLSDAEASLALLSAPWECE